MKIKPIHTLNTGHPASLALFLIGCGGTGSYAALHLAQLVAVSLKGQYQEVQVLFIDPDVVEAKNVARQNFCPAEVGQPKAVALARRYSFAYGLNIRPVVAEFTSGLLDRYSVGGWSEPGLNLVIGCVDNAGARRDIHNAVASEIERFVIADSALWWLDAGNGYTHGQVALGNALNDRPLLTGLGECFALPLPSVQVVDLLAEEVEPEPESCADLVAAGVQSRTINKMMASWIDVYCERLLVSRDLRLMRTEINQAAGTVLSVPITDGVAVEDGTKVKTGSTQEFLEGAGRLDHLCPQCNAPLVHGYDELRLTDDDWQRVSEAEQMAGEPAPEDTETADIVFCDQCNFWMVEEAYLVEADLVT